MKRMLTLVVISGLFCSCAGNKQVKQNTKAVQQQRAQESLRELDKETSGQEATESEKEGEEEGDKEEEPQCLYPFKDGLPIWVYQPDYESSLGAVGIAKKQEIGGYDAQKRLAVVIAQAELSKQVELLVNSELETEKTVIESEAKQSYQEKLKSLSKQETQQLIKNAIVKDEWLNPKTGDLYVWVVIER